MLYICIDRDRPIDSLMIYRDYSKASLWLQNYIECHEQDRALIGYYLSHDNYKNKAFIVQKEIVV